MKYKIVTSNSTSGLTTRVNDMKSAGWEIKGSHKIATRFINIERAGTVHRYDNEYSQTLTHDD